jgi:hypothetical protein
VRILDRLLKQKYRFWLRLRGRDSDRLKERQLRQSALAAASPAPDIVTVDIGPRANHDSFPSYRLADPAANRLGLDQKTTLSGGMVRNVI